MAKMLDALERARQERLKKLQSATEDPASAQAANGATNGTNGAKTNGLIGSPSSEASLASANYSVHIRGISERVVGAHHHQSPITEQVRQIRTNLDGVLSEYRSRTIVITSPVAGDGKTLVTANLATVLADDPEQQVLLVDSDMRKADQHNLYGVRQSPGLSEYLRGQCTLEQAIHTTELPNLRVLPGGEAPDKPTVLLSSDRMAHLIGELQRHYHWIIFDTPPMLPVTDALVLARDCVGIILVVRMGRTSWNVIERAQDLLAEMRLPVLGCILNEFDQKNRENKYLYRSYHREGETDGFTS